MLQNYIQLVKPGIIFGNLISALGGFFLASKGSVEFPILICMLLGVSLVIGAGCVFNNCIDRDIDSQMERTQNRAMVLGAVSIPSALSYGILLGVSGISLLYLGANGLTAMLAIIGFIIYVGFYSLYFKRNSVHGTLIGSFSGAMPPVIGYCAVSGQFDSAAWVLFIMFSLWQMPHAFAIAIFRLQDYTSSSIPVLPVKYGLSAAKKQMLIYVPLFTLASLMLTVLGYTGMYYFSAALISGIIWQWLILSNEYHQAPEKWARKQFLLSVIIVLVLSLMMSIDIK